MLLLYNDLLLSTRRFTITDEGLQIGVPMRLWSRSRLWEWKDISRLDVVTYRRDIDVEELDDPDSPPVSRRDLTRS